MIRLKTLLWERLEYDLDTVKQLAQDMGETVTEALGKGANGVAYALESGRVLKITPDRAEVALATRLRTKRLYKHIVNVYDVRALKSMDQHVIIQDRVDPLSDNHIRIWNEIRYTYMDLRWSDAEVRARIPQLIANTFKTERDDAFIDRIMPQRKGLMRDFNELRIVWREAHGANMGWNRHDSLVHFDAWQHEHYSKIPEYLRQAGGEMPRNLNPHKPGLGQDMELGLEP
jgi:hypothetical protein